MIKLKELLENKNAFRREFGEPLPTLTDVMDKHQVEEKARTICSKKIVELQLTMNLSRVVHQHHLNKTIQQGS